LQLFGYSDDKDAKAATSSTDEDATVGRRVFEVRPAYRVDTAAGSRRLRDVITQIRAIDRLDCYVTATRRGVISVWTSKVTTTIK